MTAGWLRKKMFGVPLVKPLVDLGDRHLFPVVTVEDPHHAGREADVHTPVTRTDGFPAYPEAVDLAFGPYAKYGVIVLIWMMAR